MSPPIELTDREFKILQIVKKNKAKGICVGDIFRELKKTEHISYRIFVTIIFSLKFKELIIVLKQINRETKNYRKMVYIKDNDRIKKLKRILRS